MAWDPVYADLPEELEEWQLDPELMICRQGHQQAGVLRSSLRFVLYVRFFPLVMYLKER